MYSIDYDASTIGPSPNKVPDLPMSANVSNQSKSRESYWAVNRVEACSACLKGLIHARYRRYCGVTDLDLAMIFYENTPRIQARGGLSDC